MTGSTYIPYDEALKVGMRLLNNQRDANFGLLIVVGINLGLRISDLRGLRYGQLSQKEFEVTEQKTGKKRTLSVNTAIRYALSFHISSINKDPNEHVFTTQKGTLITPQHANRLMKKYFKGKRISTHSLRKSFGRQVYDTNGKTEQALMYLSEIFQHSSMSYTRKYLGIRNEELKNIYLNL